MNSGSGMVRLVVIVILLVARFAKGQDIVGEGQVRSDTVKVLHIHKSSDQILLDGKLKEVSWSKADIAADFYQKYPMDTSYAVSKTEVRLTYDNKFLYVGAICHDEVEGPYIVQSLKRDFSFPKTDAFVMFIDPFLDGTNGFSFGCNPYGVQREGTLEVGGSWGVSTAWDNKWYCEVTRGDKVWIVEMAIPLNSIRYPENNNHWKINFARNDQKQNEKSTWIPVGRQFNVANLAFTGDLIWDEPPKKVGANVSLIPYMSPAMSKDYEEGADANGKFNIGGDAKIGLSSSLNLDLTINPDFSQVDVDRQVTNLNRFEIFFPERRQFFLENSDLFSSFGNGIARTFFSRRIGTATDSSTETLVQTPILFGARLSGKLNQNWRIGAMNLQTGRDENAGIIGQNYSVAAVQRKIGERSTLGGILVNRQSWGDSVSADGGFSNDDYNRVTGIEYQYNSKNAKWSGNTSFHKSFTPDIDKKDFFYTGMLFYYGKRLWAGGGYEHVGENYQSDVGFVPRPGINAMWPSFSYSFFPKSKKILRHGFGTFYKQVWTSYEMRTIESVVWSHYDIAFQNTAFFSLRYVHDFVELQDAFDPTRTDSEKLPAGSRYNYEKAEMFLKTDERKSIYYKMLTSYGTYFNGMRYLYDCEARYRIAPLANLSLKFTYNNIRLPAPYADADLFLIGPKLEFTFSRSVFLTTFVQYNTQSENVNLNARLQWRFKPVSDLFVVYTDNYFPETFQVKNRALVLKLTYWFNM